MALLYLSFYAGFGFYHLLPQATAFLLMCLTTAAAALLALHYDSQAVALLGLAGGYLTPVLLSTGENHMWILSRLHLGAESRSACDRAHETLARARVSRLAGHVAVIFGLEFAGWLDDETRLAAWGWLSISFALFFAASVMGARLWLLALNTGVYFAGTYFLLDHHYHSSMGGFTVALALPHALLRDSGLEPRSPPGRTSGGYRRGLADAGDPDPVRGLPHHDAVVARSRGA